MSRTALFLALIFSVTVAFADISAPVGLKATHDPESPSSRLNLKWKPVAGAVGYEVLEWKEGKWVFSEDDPSRIPFTSSTTIAGLLPSTSYKFCVRAIGGDGKPSPVGEAIEVMTRSRAVSMTSSPSQEEPTTVGLRDPKAPAPKTPTGLFAFFTESDVIKLTWRKSPRATRYYVEEQDKSGKWVTVEKFVGERSDTEILIPNHPSPGPYRFRVRAVGANGKSSDASFPVSARR